MTYPPRFNITKADKQFRCIECDKVFPRGYPRVTLLNDWNWWIEGKTSTFHSIGYRCHMCAIDMLRQMKKDMSDTMKHFDKKMTEILELRDDCEEIVSAVGL